MGVSAILGAAPAAAAVGKALEAAFESVPGASATPAPSSGVSFGNALNDALGTAEVQAGQLFSIDMGKDTVALIFAMSSIEPPKIIARFNAVRPIFDQKEYNDWLGWTGDEDMGKDMIALLFAASTITPPSVIARFNAARPVFDTPEYSAWLGWEKASA